MDKNLGPENVHKCDVIGECKRQLFDVATYRKLYAEAVEILVENCISNLRKIIEVHFYKVNYSQKKRIFNAQHWQLCHSTLLHYLENSKKSSSWKTDCRWLDFNSSINIRRAFVKIIL